MRLTKILILLLALALCFAGCKAKTEELTLVLTGESDFAQLEDYPELKKLDLTGSTCYDEIEAYIAAHPEVAVTYTVTLAGQEYAPDVTQLSLQPGFDLEELLRTLPHLPKVTSIDMTGTALTADDLARFPAGITLSYQVDILGQPVSPDATELDLSHLTPDTLDAVLDELALLPGLTSAELMDENGTSALSPADVKKLQDAFPNISFRYSFDLFGQTLSTDQESVVYLDTPMGNEAEDEIRQALDILTNCTYFKLDDCGIDSEVMASIRDDYPDVKVVWRIYCGRFSMCTDETMVRMTHGLDDTNCHELRYCTDVIYMDLGHNETLTDVSFVEYMTKLECVIISGSSVSDISAFADHDSLEFLELCFCGHLKDISMLDTCDELKYLNISFTKVSDISALEHLPLERFNSMQNNVSAASQNQFKEWHPDCLSRFTGKQPYGYGWRYIDNGITYNDYYANMRIVFRYDDKDYRGNYKER